MERTVSKVGLSYSDFIIGSLEEMCMEERMLNRIISGLHAAINTNICENYVKGEKVVPNEKFFFGTVGEFPDRMQNIYYFYSIVLR